MRFAGDMGAVLGMLGSEAPAASRLSLLEAIPAAGAAARQRVARSREVCGLLAAWAVSWADVVDGDEECLEALLKVGVPNVEKLRFGWFVLLTALL